MKDQPKFSTLELRVILKAIMLMKFYVEDNTLTPEQSLIQNEIYTKIRFDMKIEPYPGV